MAASRFLATTLWICAEQKVTVGVPEREGRRKESTNHKSCHTARVLACRCLGIDNNCGFRLKCAVVEQDDKIGFACVRVELV